MALTTTVNYIQATPISVGYSSAEISNPVLTGSIDATASTAVVGVGTLFTTELAVGNSILVSGETRVVTAITDDLNLTVDLAFTDTANDTSPEQVLTDVAVHIAYNKKMGSFNMTQSGASKPIQHGPVPCDGIQGGEWEIVGTLADVNAALEGLKWIPRTYADGQIIQDHSTINRTVGTHEGEAMFDVEDRAGLFNGEIAEGDDFTIYTGTKFITYICTRISSTYGGKRIYGIYKDEYEGNTDYTEVTLYDSTLVSLDPVVQIDNIIDYKIINPHGYTTCDITIYKDNVAFDSGVITMDGSLLTPDVPTWTTPPPTEIISNGEDVWTDPINFGEFTSPSGEWVTAQILFKRNQNDPAFTGDVTKNEPSYITDESYGIVGSARIGNAITTCYPTGFIRWQFYGSPASVKLAMDYLKIKPADKDFYIETRLIVADDRIYNHRGYN